MDRCGARNLDARRDQISATAILLLDYLEDPERDDHGEVVAGADEIRLFGNLGPGLAVSQDHPTHREAVIAALAARKRW